MTVVDGYGFIVISRKAFSESRYWLEGRVFSKWEAWLDLIQMAAYSDHERVIRGRDVFIPRGALVASERFLMKRWGWKSPGKVRRFLESLVNDGCIERDAKTEHLKLVNYEAYQGSRSSNGAVTEQSRSSDGAKRKKEKKRKKVEEEKTPSPSPAGAGGARLVWDAFLAARREHFTRKNGRDGSTLLLTEPRRQLILARLRDYPADDVADACRGLFLSRYHCGENDQGTPYLSLEMALSVNRSRNNVEKFRDLYRQTTTKAGPTQRDGLFDLTGKKRFSEAAGDYIPAEEWGPRADA